MADTWQSAMKKMQPAVNSIVKVISKEISELLRENLDNLYYKRVGENEYERTYELLNSIDVSEVSKSGNKGYYATIFFNDDKLSRGAQSNSPWTQHSSMVDNSIIYGGNLAWVIDQGAITPFHIFDGVNFEQATIDDLNKIAGIIQKQLKIRGYDVLVRF